MSSSQHPQTLAFPKLSITRSCFTVWPMCVRWVQMMCVGAPVPEQPWRRRKLKPHRVNGVHHWALSLPKATPGKAPHVPGGNQSACVGQEREGIWQRSGKQAVPKTTSLVWCRQAAPETVRVDLLVSVSASGQDLPSLSGCRSLDSRAVVLTAVAQRKGAVWDGFGSQQWSPPHLSLAARKKSEAAHGGRQTHTPPPAPMGMREVGRADGWWQQPPATLWGGPWWWHRHRSRWQGHCPQ